MAGEVGSEKEALIPEAVVGQRRFKVVISEVTEVMRHKQNYQQNGVDEHGKATFGYRTTASRETLDRVIFVGEFTERPRISALAQLMEHPNGNQ